MEFPKDDDERRAHMDRCEGCQLINQHRNDSSQWIPCYEHQQRNIAAINRLVELYNYNPQNPESSYPTVIGNDGKPVINLMSLVEDIATRYEKGTLTPGEHRIR